MFYRICDFTKRNYMHGGIFLVFDESLKNWIVWQENAFSRFATIRFEPNFQVECLRQRDPYFLFA